MHSPTPSPFRLRRRLIFFSVLIITIIFFFGAPWELSSALEQAGVVSTGLSRANIVSLVRPKKVDEIYGLLHFVTRNDQILLSDPTELDPSKPIDLGVYGGEKEDWKKNMEALNEEFPVIVFSKTYCPYSRSAKELLTKYDLLPEPKIVEVDIRDDGDLIKLILKRLTGRATFPNVIIKGTSIGGSDDVHALDSEGKLKAIFEEAGVLVQGDVSNES